MTQTAGSDLPGGGCCRAAGKTPAGGPPDVSAQRGSNRGWERDGPGGEASGAGGIARW